MGHTLVLNPSYQPLGVITEQEAICLIVQEVAWTKQDDPTKPYRSPSITINAPKVIVLNHFVKPKSFRFKPERLTNLTLFRRDSYTCGYCGRHKKQLNGERLTRDHIQPLSKGGTDTWPNVITACETCNLFKADRTPEEAKMPMKFEPTIPITWTLRGKHKLTRAQLKYVEELLGINS